ncbi:MAG: site-specific integrase [Gemmataceae bacterium]|nr:site-specific integrase [Gemmataceae bacterium]MCI0742038.1 site-specific integrase [Gemmataceae bacterium]
MASISCDAAGRRRIIFKTADGRRRALHLGEFPQKAAEQIKTKVEAILAAQLARAAVDAETARWVGSVQDDLATKLANVGLIDAREAPVGAFLGTFLHDYIAKRTDVKPNTLKTIHQARRLLVEHFGPRKPMRDITRADIKDWLVFLQRPRKRRNSKEAKGYAQATIATHLKKARTMFEYAAAARLIDTNPFHKAVKMPKQTNKSREVMVSREIIDKVIDATGDTEWKLVIALARFGGLRCPSEVKALRWQWIDWEGDRFTVFSPKKEHLGDAAWRIVPIFPELRPYLQAAWDEADVGAVYVIARHRGPNLYTGIGRIVQRAGFQKWERLVQNMRGTRETELAESFPVHVVAAWLGNTPKIAAAHYLQVTEEHMQRASRARQTTRATAVSGRMESQQENGSVKNTGNLAHSTHTAATDYPRQESNL